MLLYICFSLNGCEARTGLHLDSSLISVWMQSLCVSERGRRVEKPKTLEVTGQLLEGKLSMALCVGGAQASLDRE